jgi:MFS family permease
LPAVLAGFAGFAVLGFFTAMVPAFMQQVLGQHSLALIGLVAGMVFFSSTLGQVLQGRITPSWRLPLGCLIVIAGALLIGTGILQAALTVFLCGALFAGVGQGIAFRAGLGAIAAACPGSQRGAVTSTFFVIVYIALSIPVVGIGLAARYLGLVATGAGFAGLVALLCSVALVLVLRGARRSG